MADKMAEVHVTVAGVVVHNPAQHPLPVGAGVPVTAAAKTPGNPNGSVHGQVTNTSIVHNNPA